MFREPLELLEKASWDLAHPAGQACLRYVRSMIGRLLNSLAIENTYNDMRENEGRAARHKTRGNNRLSALAVSSLSTRYAGMFDMVNLGAEQVARFNRFLLRPNKTLGRGR